MDYISLFTGIGGLESHVDRPLLCCEIDETCHPVLERRYGSIPIHADVATLSPPASDVVAGGWPCQDISVAGLRRGLAGERSGLFFEMLRVARESDAHTLVAENVPNLLTMEGGRAFEGVLEALDREGYPHISWRMLNAREFGLPHHRNRVFLVASRHREVARSLHRPHDVEAVWSGREPDDGAAGFYWTGGLQSICYGRGFVPALKVGSSLSIPSPPAVHFDGCARKATPGECLSLQGFDPDEFASLRSKDVYRLSGNAVPCPVGSFVMDSVEARSTDEEPPVTGFGRVSGSGMRENGTNYVVDHGPHTLVADLHRFIDVSERRGFSARAARGLLGRLRRSGKPCPGDLWELLLAYSRQDDEDGEDAVAGAADEPDDATPGETRGRRERLRRGESEDQLTLL